MSGWLHQPLPSGAAALAGGTATGTAAQTLPRIGQSGNALHALPATGSAAQELPSIAQSANAFLQPSGVAAQALSHIRQSASVLEKFIATAAMILPRIRQSASGRETIGGSAVQGLASILQSATGIVTVGAMSVLPKASPGMKFMAMVRDAIDFETWAGDTIYDGDETGTRLSSDAIGSIIVIICPDSGMWTVLKKAGTWELN